VQLCTSFIARTPNTEGLKSGLQKINRFHPFQHSHTMATNCPNSSLSLAFKALSRQSRVVLNCSSHSRCFQLLPSQIRAAKGQCKSTCTFNSMLQPQISHSILKFGSLLPMFAFVGKASLQSLHMKTFILGGIFKDHNFFQIVVSE